MSEPHDHHHKVPADVALRVKALETALTERGYVQTETLDAIVDAFENKVGPRNGAQVIARAWSDPAFKQRLLDNATAAMGELGFGGFEGADITVVENQAGLHNMVVCTLCSCYPWPLLGLPPGWYKSFAYRSRAVSEPRAHRCQQRDRMGHRESVTRRSSRPESCWVDLAPSRQADRDPN